MESKGQSTSRLDTFKVSSQTVPRKQPFQIALIPCPAISKWGTVAGRYVSPSHPRLNSIKESTKTYGSGASDMIRVFCTRTPQLWFIPSFIWSLTVWVCVCVWGGYLVLKQLSSPRWTCKRLAELTSYNQLVMLSLSSHWKPAADKKMLHIFQFIISLSYWDLERQENPLKLKTVLLSWFPFLTMQRSNCTPYPRPSSGAAIKDKRYASWDRDVSEECVCRYPAACGDCGGRPGTPVDLAW